VQPPGRARPKPAKGPAAEGRSSAGLVTRARSGVVHRKALHASPLATIVPCEAARTGRDERGAILKRTYKVLGITAAVVAVALAALGIALSHNSRCGRAAALLSDTPRMKAIVSRCYGPPAVLKLEEIAKPLQADDRVLVKVHAASVNPLDWHYMRGEPYFMRAMTGMGAPDDVRRGVDFAGTVESVGKNVTQFKPGDAVFGGRDGAFAEYVSVREQGSLALKPTNLSFEQAAAVPIAAVTALQALRDKGRVHPGQSVLINGASGGVGTFAVQIAKAYGAKVTGVCSTRNVHLVQSIGADHVIDYTQEDFTQGSARYDLIIDTVGTHSVWEYRGVLNPDGMLVMVGALDKGPWLGPMWSSLKAFLIAPFITQKFVFFLANLDPADLGELRDLMQAGKVTPVIDRTYALNEVPAAIGYLEQGHARGKVVIAVN
jgi:NADPH:quinone reductase-like Zn-dependent oxidoreductase